MFAQKSYRNRVVSQDLVVLYDTERVDYTIVDGEEETHASWYRVTRRASKKYSYVDMTQVGAMNAASELVALYTRQTAILGRRTGRSQVPPVILVGTLTSSITVNRETGNVWRVDVQVEEEDVRASLNDPSTPSSLFTAENARDYDTSGGYFDIVSAKFSALTNKTEVKLTGDLSGLVDDSTVILVKYSPLDVNWVSIPFKSSSVTGTIGNFFLTDSSIVADQSIIQVASGMFSTSTFTVTAVPVRAITITDAFWMYNGQVDYTTTLPSMDSATISFANSSEGPWTTYEHSEYGISWSSSSVIIEMGSAAFGAGSWVKLNCNGESSDPHEMPDREPS